MAEIANHEGQDRQCGLVILVLFKSIIKCIPREGNNGSSGKVSVITVMVLSSVSSLVSRDIGYSQDIKEDMFMSSLILIKCKSKNFHTFVS